MSKIESLKYDLVTKLVDIANNSEGDFFEEMEELVSEYTSDLAGELPSLPDTCIHEFSDSKYCGSKGCCDMCI